MEDISPSHQAYWQMAKALKSDTIASMPPLFKNDLPPASNDNEKTECIAESFQNQCTKRQVGLLGALYPVTNDRSKLSLRNKVTLFKTCILSVLTYTGVVFVHIPSYKIHKLQDIQNIFMLSAIGAPLYVRNHNLHKDLGLQTVAALLKEQSKRYFVLATQTVRAAVRNSCQAHGPSSSDSHIQTPNMKTTRAALAFFNNDLIRTHAHSKHSPPVPPNFFLVTIDMGTTASTLTSALIIVDVDGNADVQILAEALHL
ncbi:hypothetical protein EVAR_75093_1 [Eumeta japonica]|uniref:Uncharacterized protein n=1 Tax=Eumeta variegata TaxID=151549 RepID=A0A4C1U0C5_EUMVA|nr:hypothetical protein EVAR_75093_1 [Eumeta japonica]